LRFEICLEIGIWDLEFELNSPTKIGMIGSSFAPYVPRKLCKLIKLLGLNSVTDKTRVAAAGCSQF